MQIKNVIFNQKPLWLKLKKFHLCNFGKSNTHYIYILCIYIQRDRQNMYCLGKIITLTTH